MASRVGKYKVSKKESALSLADGGEIQGAVTLSGATTLSNASITISGLTSGNDVVSSSLSSNQLFRTASAFATSSQAGAQNVHGKLYDILCITK